MHNFLLSKVSTAAHGTKRLDMESLKNTAILLPTIVQQNQFVEIANKFSSVKSGQTLSLEQNKAMFNSLSQRAFRGEL
jgi:type I restriction enzyme S subunit